jgi:hypothetical protein
MWQVLADAGLTYRRCLAEGISPATVNQQTGEVVQHIKDVQVWRLFEKVMRGARQLEWSRAFKKRHAIVEISDEQLALEVERGDRDELLLDIPKASKLWDMIQARPAGMAQVISAGGDGMEGLWDLFLEWGWGRRELLWCEWGDERLERMTEGIRKGLDPPPAVAA